MACSDSARGYQFEVTFKASADLCSAHADLQAFLEKQFPGVRVEESIPTRPRARPLTAISLATYAILITTYLSLLFTVYHYVTHEVTSIIIAGTACPRAKSPSVQFSASSRHSCRKKTPPLQERKTTLSRTPKARKKKRLNGTLPISLK